MNKYFTPLLIAAACSAQAQWTTDVSMNTAVRAASGNDAGSMLIADGPDGSTYSCWFETVAGNYELHMQRMDAAGNRLWADDGLVVSDHPQNSAIYRSDLKTDADGNAVVAFQDERTGALDIVAYKIDPDGNNLWGADGVELPTPGTTGLAPSVACLSNGNTAIAWNTNDSPGQIAVQLVGPAGDPLLLSPNLIAEATRVSRPVPVATTDGGFIIQYELEGSFFLTPATMYAQRYDAAGFPVWTAPVVVSTQTIPGFFFPAPVADGQDGIYLAFDSSNPDNPSFTDVFVQRVRGDGSLWSATGTRMDNDAGIQKFTAGKKLVWLNDANGLMVPIQGTDGAQGQSGLLVQRVDTAGVRQLGDQAVPVILIAPNGPVPADISATVDGAVIVTYQGAFGQEHIASTRVDLNGLPVDVPAQMDLSTVNSNKGDIQSSGLSNGQVVVVWEDDRALAGVYAQNITGLDIISGIQPVEAANNGFSLQQNPAQKPVLLLPANLQQGSQITVYDAQGKQVYAQAAPTMDRVELPLLGFSSGVYTVRLLSNGQAATVRWVK